MNLYEYDKQFNIQSLCGVDEAGRGPLAGDVYAGAVILPEDCDIVGLDDSKKLSEKKRDALYEQIIEKAVAYSIGIATVQEIDEYNILNATFFAMNRAVEGLCVKPEFVLIDGDKNPIKDIPSRSVIKGDGMSASIAAASIIAKVSRDRYMQKLGEQYPEYQFHKHKGYGTKLHYEMLDENGISDIHRMSFLKKYLKAEKKPPTARQTGNDGEDEACRLLTKNGYTIIEKNFFSVYGEIDIIAEKGDFLAFVEVKTRNPNSLQSPAEAVSKSKQGKIIKTALMYYNSAKLDRQPRFDVIEVFLGNDKKIISEQTNHIENAFNTEGHNAYI